MNSRCSGIIYVLMVLIMLAGRQIWTYYELVDPLVQRQINSLDMMILVSLLGFAALYLGKKTNFPDVWDDKVSNKGRFLIPFIVGVTFGLIQIVMSVVQNLKVPMIEFPLSIPVYLSLGILSELVFHFIPVVFLLWLISNVILGHRWENKIYWIIAILVSSWEPVMQLIAMYDMGVLKDVFSGVIPFFLMFFANMVPIHFLRKYGLLASVVWRLSDYLVWHIIWGGFFM